MAITASFILAVLVIEQFALFPIVNAAYYHFHLNQVTSNFIFKTSELILFIVLNVWLTKQKIFLMPARSWLTFIFFLFIAIVCAPSLSSAHLAEAFMTGLMGGVPEEYFVRGVLLSFFLTYLVRNNYSRPALVRAIVYANLVFAVMHLTNLTHQPVAYVVMQCVLAFVSGLSYSAIYVQTGSLWAAMAMHFTKDFLLTADVANPMANVVHSAFSVFQLLLVVTTFIYWKKHEPRLVRLVRHPKH